MFKTIFLDNVCSQSCFPTVENDKHIKTRNIHVNKRLYLLFVAKMITTHLVLPKGRKESDGIYNTRVFLQIDQLFHRLQKEEEHRRCPPGHLTCNFPFVKI